MIYRSTQEISNYFTMREIKHRIDEANGLSYVETGVNGKVVKNVIIRFFSRSDANDVDIRVLNLGMLAVPEERKADLLVTLNELNCKYRFVKFSLYSDGSITVSYDIGTAVSLDDLGEVCREMFIRLISILDEVYPVIMKTLWAG
ncbi:MAG: YbjN domain-containing protein [Clostridia bacterium]|nr:YbjN domain-containing protein [Clostridia bacterium]